MEREVRYCTTEDGVRIAYCTSGTGKPLVWATDILSSHIQREWDFHVLANTYRAIASRHTLVRFDSRGAGLSDREVEDLSLEARVRDLEAVVNALKLERFVLCGEVYGGLVAVEYAVRHPERVSKLVLYGAFAKASQGASAPHIDTLRELLLRNWEMFTENVGSLEFGWGEARAREFGKFIRDAISHNGALRAYGTLLKADVTDLLPKISCPTLVAWGARQWSESHEGGA